MMISKYNLLNGDYHTWIKSLIDYQQDGLFNNKLSLCRICKWSCDNDRVHFGNTKFISTSNLNHQDKIESGYESMSNATDMKVIKPNDCAQDKQAVYQSGEVTLVKIRESIEQLVEELLGRSLDTAHVNKPYHHPKYTQHLDQYKDRLSLVLLDLTESLYLALQDQTVDEDDAPAAAYARFKKLFLKLTEASSKLPQLPLNQFSDEEDDLDESLTYEDLLAIAIINELVANGQANQLIVKQMSKQTMLNSSGHLIDVGIQSDLGDTESIGSRSDNSQDTFVYNKSEPGLILEEEIEEITTTKSYSGSDEDLTEESKLILDPYGLKIDLSDCFDKVPFPEMGIDLLDSSQLLNNDEKSEKLGTGLKLIDSTFWEENWLFRKKSKSANEAVPQFCLINLQQADNPILMFIPNPSQMISPKIGTQSVDKLSELSECNSVRSLNFSSSSETEIDQDESQFQKEQNGDIDVNSIYGSIKRRIKKSFNNLPKKIHCSNHGSLKASPDFVSQEQRINEPSVHDPCFIICPQSASVQPNILIQFCCKVKGTPPLGVCWFKQGKMLTEFERIRMFKHFNQYILEIKGTQKDDSGHYSCVVYNHLNKSWCDFTIEVRDLPLPSKRQLEKHGCSKIQKNKLDYNKEAKIYYNKKESNLKEENQSESEPLPGTIAEREHKKWTESTVEWPQNPYTSESIEKRKHLIFFNVSNENELKMTEDQEEENLCALPYISPSKDLERFKRDYYLPNLNSKDSINGIEQKLHSSQKIVSSRVKSNPDIESEKEHVNEVVSHTSQNDDIKSKSKSLVSVRNLINKFSDNGNENNKNEVKSNEVNNSKAKCKITPVKLNYNVQSITGRRMTKEFLNFSAQNWPKNGNKPGSLNIIDKSSDQGSKRGEQDVVSNDKMKERSNDDLNQPKSNQNENVEKIKKSNRSMAPSILKRATFWEKKCEEAI